GETFNLCTVQDALGTLHNLRQRHIVGRVVTELPRAHSALERLPKRLVTLLDRLGRQLVRETYDPLRNAQVINACKGRVPKLRSDVVSEGAFVAVLRVVRQVQRCTRVPLIPPLAQRDAAGPRVDEVPTIFVCLDAVSEGGCKRLLGELARPLFS